MRDRHYLFWLAIFGGGCVIAVGSFVFYKEYPIAFAAVLGLGLGVVTLALLALGYDWVTPDQSPVAAAALLQHRNDVADFAKQTFAQANSTPGADPAQSYSNLNAQGEKLRDALFSHYPTLRENLRAATAARTERFRFVQLIRFKANDVAKSQGFDEPQAAAFLAEEATDIALRGEAMVSTGRWSRDAGDGTWCFDVGSRRWRISSTANDGALNRFMNVAQFVDEWDETQALIMAAAAEKQAKRVHLDQLAEIVLKYQALPGKCELCS